MTNSEQAMKIIKQKYSIRYNDPIKNGRSFKIDENVTKVKTNKMVSELADMLRDVKGVRVKTHKTWYNEDNNTIRVHVYNDVAG